MTSFKILREVRINKRMHYECVCSCGRTFVARKDNVSSGRTKSCKECNKDRKGTHLVYRTPQYRIASGIYSRCYCKTSKSYELYKNVYAPKTKLDICKMLMGVDGYFDGAQIDRIDNTKGYEEGNLRWVTAKENMNNRTSSVECEHYERFPSTRANFKKMCKIKEWEFEDFEEIYSGKKNGTVKKYFYKKK